MFFNFSSTALSAGGLQVGSTCQSVGQQRKSTVRVEVGRDIHFLITFWHCIQGGSNNVDGYVFLFLLFLVSPAAAAVAVAAT